MTPNTSEEVGMFIGVLLRSPEVAVSGSGPGAQAVHKGKVQDAVGEGTCSGCFC